MWDKASLSLSILMFIVAYAGSADAANIVTAEKVRIPPVLSAGAADPAWSRAKALAVPLMGGANFKQGSTNAQIKAVYSDTMFYMLIQYEDPTESLRRMPYQKQADGSWKKLQDKNNKGGDENTYYEDKLALIWNIGGLVKNFGQMGCMASCHVGEAGKPFGNKYTSHAGELADIWHVKSVRTIPVGQVDDQYLDHTRYDRKKSPGAGRKGDPKTGGGYANIALKNGRPEFMDKNGRAANGEGGAYFIKSKNKSPFDDRKFNAGDEVASIVISPFAGDRGDISGSMTWKNGEWTVVIARKLVTGSKYDVQFEPRDQPYEFGVAAFDNAQVRHAYHIGSLKLQFAR